MNTTYFSVSVKRRGKSQNYFLQYYQIINMLKGEMSGESKQELFFIVWKVLCSDIQLVYLQFQFNGIDVIFLVNRY